MEYPSLNLNNNIFQKNISLKFKSIKNKKTNQSRKELCFPKKFKYQLPQLFVKEFINPNTPYKGLLLYHKIGSGKTCAAIQIAEQWKDIRKVFIITPASLIANMYQELRGECTGNSYVSKEERELLNNLNKDSLEYINLIKNINKKINKIYKIYSHNKFVNLINSNSINLRNSLIIIDEVHNIISESGTLYTTFYNFIINAPDSLRIVLLTATPIVDKPSELGLTINLLRPKHILPIGNAFNNTFIQDMQINNSNELQQYLNGYVSYFKGAPSKVFPIQQFKLINCRMSRMQYNMYSKIRTKESKNKEINLNQYLDIQNNFFIKSRIASNILLNSELNINKLKIYSCKFYKLLKKLNYSRGTVFIYSTFKEFGGIKSLVKVLEQNGYTDFSKDGPGNQRFAMWTGNETSAYKSNILSQFNDISNQNGSKLKILLGSPSMKEGISLLRVREVHILEPHWNMSRIKQIIGRAIRFCSHKDVDKNKRIVKVYLYCATSPKGNTTIDQYIYSIALEKEKLINQFEKLLQESAVDKDIY